MMIKAVIFDLDNTLYSYDECNEKATDALRIYACSRYKISAEEFEKAYSWAKAQVKHQLGNTGASHNRMLYMQLFLERIGCSPLDGSLDLYDLYWNTMLENMHAYSYVDELLKLLKESKIKIGILTDLTAHIQHRKIFKLGIDRYVDAIVTSEEAGEEKPASCMFKTMLTKLDVAATEALMVGDSKEKDIEGALGNGIDGILVTSDNIENMHSIVMEYIDARNNKE